MLELGHLLPGAAPLTVGKGVSDTYVGVIETVTARKQAYVKFLPPRELANELLGSVLASALNLRTPQPYLVLATRAEYPSAFGFEDPAVQSTIAFATEQLGYSALARRVDLQSWDAKRALVNAWSEWPDVVTFDDWIANGDRHAGNYLIGDIGEVWLIDHGYAFTGPNWTASTLSPVVAPAHRLWQDLISQCVDESHKGAAVTVVQKMAQRLSDVDITKAIVDATTVDRIGYSDAIALSKFLNERIATVATRVSNTLGVPLLPFEAQQ